MSRSVDQRIADILEAIDRCERYAGALSSDDPDLVDMAEDAVARNLQVIGEATKHLPPDIISSHPEIPWPQIRGFRNILVHRYFGIDVATVRDVIQTHLPPLAAALRGHLSG